MSVQRSAGRGAVPLPRVVFDTKALVSALLFKGISSRLVPLWQSRRLLFLLSRPILDEYLRTLAYPKFNLIENEIRFLIEEEVLPYVEVISIKSGLEVPFLKDTSDRKFLECVRQGKANYLVTGDKEFLSLKRVGKTLILPPAEFLGTVGSWTT